MVPGRDAQEPSGPATAGQGLFGKRAAGQPGGWGLHEFYLFSVNRGGRMHV